MIARASLLAAATLAALILLAPATAVSAEEECALVPRSQCFDIASVGASLSTTQAGDHPDVTFSVDLTRDPQTPVLPSGEHDGYADTRDIRFDLPPGLIGDPNVLGAPQQCTVAELAKGVLAECPNGSQVGVTAISIALGANEGGTFKEPIYMMVPPAGSDVVARLGIIAALYPVFIDVRVRSEGDYGLTSEISEIPPAARLLRTENTLWGVPSAPSHDTERCTPGEILLNCTESPPRPPGSRPLPFFTNPTSCGVPLRMGIAVSSWAEPARTIEEKADFPTISGCNKLPFGPRLTANPTNHHTSSPTGLDLTIQLPPSDGVKVLEPAQTRDIRIDLPEGIAINPGSADGLATCSVALVHFKENVASECPDAAKMAATEFEIGGLPRRMRGAIYLREPEPGHLFRIWIVADDLGAHVKLPGQLEVSRTTGQIKSVVLDNPQVPLREVKLLFKSGFRAPLMTPATCGAYIARYQFTPWSGGPPAIGEAPMSISEGCEVGGFSPGLAAGSTLAQGGAFSPFAFTISREDSEQNLSGLDVTLPRGMAASFAGTTRCEGADAITGLCPPASRIGRTTVADGAGPSPLWVPQPGKDPTAVYLSGPYKGAPFSIVAVVPAQAGPFDLGLEVVRSAVYVDPKTAQATAKTDPLPQIIEGIPITYKTVNVVLDRPNFTLNPTSCAPKQATALLTSSRGRVAGASSGYTASNCAKLPFKPALALRLFGGTKRSSHPKLKATVKLPAGGANIAAASVALPHSQFLEQAHIKTVCTRVQFAADECPAGSVYGSASAKTPLFDFPLTGPVYLRSSSNPLPDLVMALKGPASFPIEIELAGRVDSVNGGLRTTFDQVPDAPVSEFTLEMQGGKKGLIVNSTNLCAKVNRATARFTGQNGKLTTLRPALQNGCKKKAGQQGGSKRRGR